MLSQAFKQVTHAVTFLVFMRFCCKVDVFPVKGRRTKLREITYWRQLKTWGETLVSSLKYESSTGPRMKYDFVFWQLTNEDGVCLYYSLQGLIINLFISHISLSGPITITERKTDNYQPELIPVWIWQEQKLIYRWTNKSQGFWKNDIFLTWIWNWFIWFTWYLVNRVIQNRRANRDLVETNIMIRHQTHSNSQSSDTKTSFFHRHFSQFCSTVSCAVQALQSVWTCVCCLC